MSAAELNECGVCVAHDAVERRTCAACLAEVHEQLQRMLLLPGHVYDNRHFLRFPTARGATTHKEPTHQRDFTPPWSSCVEAVLRDFLASPAGEILVEAVGRDAEMVEMAAIISDPGATAQAIHSDSCWSATSPRLITVFLALHDILDEVLGPTRFCPGTQNPSCFPEGAGWLAPPDAYTQPHPQAEAKLAEVPPVWFAMNAGDAVLMESTTWHLGGANTSEQRRSLLSFSFVAHNGSTKTEKMNLRLGDLLG